MDLLITLLIAHLFADFPLQTNALANLKERHWFGVLLHVIVHIVVMALLINNSQQYWKLISAIGMVHFLIDVAKLYCPNRKSVTYFLADQFFHFITILMAAYIAAQVWQPLPEPVLPGKWLVLILGGAFIPALLVLFWVWLDSLSQDYLARFHLLHWTKHRLLTLEQGFGLTLIGLVFLQSVLYSWIGVVQFPLR